MNAVVPGAVEKDNEDETEGEEGGEHEEDYFAEDVEDTFAMLASILEEEVYRVILDIIGKQGAESPEASEEENEVHKVTCDIKGKQGVKGLVAFEEANEDETEGVPLILRAVQSVQLLHTLAHDMPMAVTLFGPAVVLMRSDVYNDAVLVVPGPPGENMVEKSAEQQAMIRSRRSSFQRMEVSAGRST